jgi:hypothetical protein
VEVTRSDGRPGAAYAATEAELPELERSLGEDPGVAHWTVTTEDVEGS